MRYTEIVYLIGRESSQDDVGNIVYNETKRKVYGIKRKVGISEFYNATSVGLSISAELRIKTDNYCGEEEAEYNGKRYAIIRTVPFNHQDLIMVLGTKQGYTNE